ncbi:MAG: cell division protein ZapE [Pseudomonadota bacterium]
MPYTPLGLGPMPQWDRLIQHEVMEADPAQIAVMKRLQDLHVRIGEARLAIKSSPLGWMFARKAKPEPIKGLYIWGSVGRGKTALMDVFFEAASPKRKRRIHYHAFMGDVHARIHAHRQALKAGTVKGDDPIPPVADAISDEVELLCLDEFQVTDIADAMVLGRLFDRLFERRLVLVATSNVEPDSLYKNGLNRDLFLPFIARFKERMEIITLDARTDYRLEKLAGRPVYFVPPDKAEMDAVWDRLTGGLPGKPTRIKFLGHDIPIPRASHGVARASFKDWCEVPLGAKDYLEIARTFHTVIFDDIPALIPERRNEARRFVWLIDAFYDNAVKLIASAEAEPHALYPTGDTAFEFERTVSRLIEMRSHDYLGRAHAVTAHPTEGQDAVA